MTVDKCLKHTWEVPQTNLEEQIDRHASETCVAIGKNVIPNECEES